MSVIAVETKCMGAGARKCEFVVSHPDHVKQHLPQSFGNSETLDILLNDNDNYFSSATLGLLAKFEETRKNNPTHK